MFRDFDSGLLYKYLHQSFRTKLKENYLMNVSLHIAIIAIIIAAIIAAIVDAIT